MSFRFLTAGESHGKCLTAIIEGMPAGVRVSTEEINARLAGRQQGYGRGGRMKIEKDKVIINSGVRHGITTGAPITLVIENKDWENWKIPMSVEPVDLENPEVRQLVDEKKITHVRPGHSDLPGSIKYNHRDIRDVLERSSARETAARTAVGAFAQQLLKEMGMEVFGHVLRIGSVGANRDNLPEDYGQLRQKAESSELRCADNNASEEMKKIIDRAKEEGDTLGGTFEVVALNVPAGLGSYVHWDKRLDARLAYAVMSIPAIKSVGIGAAEKVSEIPGSQTHDEIFPEEGTYTRKTNSAGGIEGGVSNGMPVIVKAVMKAIPTMKKPLNSVDISTGQAHLAHYERSDVCAVPAASVVGEAMVSIVLVKALLERFGGDNLDQLKKILNYTRMS